MSATTHNTDLIKILQHGYEEMLRGYDLVLGVFGSEGVGKSTGLFLNVMDCWYNEILKKEPTSLRFSVHLKDWRNVIKQAERFDFCGMDETGDLLNKKDHARKFNKVLYQTYTIIRGKQFLTCFVMPSLFDLESDFRNNRLAGAFHVYERVSHKCKECQKSFAGEKCPYCDSCDYRPGHVKWRYYTRKMLTKLLVVNATLPAKTMAIGKGLKPIEGTCYEYKGIYRTHYDELKQEKMDMALEKMDNVIVEMLQDDTAYRCPACGIKDIRWRRRDKRWACTKCPHTWTMEQQNQRLGKKSREREKGKVNITSPREGEQS